MKFEYHIGILAGGKSRRFGSNKLLYVLEGEPLLLHIVKEIPKLLMQPTSITLSLYDFSQYEEIISFFLKKEEFKRISKFSWTYTQPSNLSFPNIMIDILLDTYHGIDNKERAAIFGLQNICNKITKGYLQIIPCDTPYFDARAINYHLDILRNSSIEFDAIIPQWKNQFTEPLNSLYKVQSIKHIIDRNIKNHEYTIRKIILTSLKVRFLEIEKEFSPFLAIKKIFQNLNEIPI
ncbi:MAG: NTP transferase domain-containing protein [Promethearchaeota archaeon]